jgi:hypothetical protein
MVGFLVTAMPGDSYTKIVVFESTCRRVPVRLERGTQPPRQRDKILIQLVFADPTPCAGDRRLGSIGNAARKHGEM